MKNSLRISFCMAALLMGGILRAADIEPPVPVRMVAPDYPTELRASGTSGMVVLSCDIDDKGAVTDAKIARTTNDGFNKAAMAAVEKWRFRPAQKDGKPVAVHINLPIKFSNGE